MMEDHYNPNQLDDRRKELCEQVAAIFVNDGITVDAEVMAYMHTLLDGSQDYENHRALVEKLMAEIRP